MAVLFRAVPRIGVAERRSRLLRRHHLAPADRAPDVPTAAADLVGLHATDPVPVYLAAAARVDGTKVADVERALYEERSVLRMLGMRRTLFVLPVDLAPVVHAACTRAIAVRERKRLIQMVEQGGVAEDAARWVEEANEATMRALAARGEALANELSADVPALRAKVRIAEGKSYAADANLTTFVISRLAAEGRIARGRPRGTWISSQHRWASIDSWFPNGLPELPTEAARVELVRRWLASYGPAMVADIKWWTGWTLGETRKALAELPTAEVDLDGAAGVVLADDVEPEPPVAPVAVFLPALDPSVMGWSERDWYLGAHREVLFDRNGNAGPTVWWDGRVVGGWAVRADATVAFRLLERVGREARVAVEDAAGRLEAWLDGTRFTPRFRTPLERDLSA
jgi:Winged helix DNA-binding domain